MFGKSLLLKAGAALAPLLVMLALGGAQPAQAAGSMVIVATSLNPADCGKYHTAQSTDLAAVLNSATQGKVLICPGTYNLSADVKIIGAKGLKIIQAVKGVQPHIVVGASTTAGLWFQDSSNVLLSGLYLDSSANTNPTYIAIRLERTSASVTGSTLYGSTTTSIGIMMDARTASKFLKLTVSKSQVLGYLATGIFAQGPARLAVTKSTLDGTDSGRVLGGLPTGILFYGETTDALTPTGSVSKSVIRNHYAGIEIRETSKVSISKNTLDSNGLGITVSTFGIYHHVAQNNKIVGNTVTVTAPDGIGIYVIDLAADPSQFKLLKTTINKNVVSAPAPNTAGFGMLFIASMAAQSTVTVVALNNKINNFTNSNAIVNQDGFVGLKQKKNVTNP